MADQAHMSGALRTVEQAGRLGGGRVALFPRFDAMRLISLIESLGEQGDQARYERALKAHRMSMVRALLTIVALILFVLAILVFDTLLLTDIRLADRFGVFLGVVLVFVHLLAVGGLLIQCSYWKSGARIRFFRRVKVAVSLLTQRERVRRDIGDDMSQIGRAARALFTVIQGTGLLWAPPPAVRDRTLGLTFPIINIVLDARFDRPGPQRDALRNALACFIYDVAGLVALRREDLIPELRNSYSILSERAELTAIPERDALFLDPTWDRNRMAVLRDFLFPAAGWISAMLAGTTLLVTLLLR